MEFTKRLRAGVRSGEITRSVRIWTRPHVKPGNRYRMSNGEGEIEIDSIQQIELADIDAKLARESGFTSVIDLLKVAKHGRGTNVYLVRFHYVPPGKSSPAGTLRSRAPGGGPPVERGSVERERARMLRILDRLPEAQAVALDTHVSLEVRKKRFGYFLVDHRGDGRIALNCKASPDVREALQAIAPEQFHVPKYLGNKGWVGLWLDRPKLSASALELALREAYALVAPKTTARKRARKLT